MKSTPLPMPQDSDSGSPTPGEPEFLVVGKLGKPHGIHGEIVMDVYTDFPERVQQGVTVFIGPQFLPLQIIKRRPHARGLLMTIDGYQTREGVAELRNQLVYVPTADRPQLEAGEYYHHQLLGLQVIDEEDRLLGSIERILETGANDVYVVHDESGAELLVPDIESVVLEIDLDHNQMLVHLLPGLLPQESST
jgi:16S rRNA processing protein RimM